MGAAYAPNYAGLFLGYWEERYVNNNVNPFRQYIKFYGRYIDDLLFIFTGSEQQLLDFHKYLNSTNPNIKLTLEYSKAAIDFLDLKISIDQLGTIHTYIFRKSTDRNTILRAESFHPKHFIISNIPFGQFQRLKRICNTDSEFEAQAHTMYDRFSQRGYNKNNLNAAWTKARDLDRTRLLNPERTPPKSQNKIFCTMQYSNLTPEIKRTVSKNWDILACDPTLGPMFSEPPVFAFRRAPTLKDKLVRSYLPPEKPSPFFKKPIGTYKCGSCKHCTNINRATTFMNSTCTRSYQCRSFANCNTTFVVYRLDCVCGCFLYRQNKTKIERKSGRTQICY